MIWVCGIRVLDVCESGSLLLGLGLNFLGFSCDSRLYPTMQYGFSSHMSSPIFRITDFTLHCNLYAEMEVLTELKFHLCTSVCSN